MTDLEADWAAVHGAQEEARPSRGRASSADAVTYSGKAGNSQP